MLSDIDTSCKLYRRYAMSNFIKNDNIAQLYVKSLNNEQEIDDNVIHKLYIANNSIKTKATFILFMKAIIKHALVMGRERLINKLPMLKYIKPHNINVNLNESEQIALINNDSLKSNEDNKNSHNNCYFLICQTMLLEMINENLGDINELLMDLSNNMSTKRKRTLDCVYDDEEKDDSSVKDKPLSKYRKKISSYLSCSSKEEKTIDLNSLVSITPSPKSTFVSDHLSSSVINYPETETETDTNNTTSSSTTNKNNNDSLDLLTKNSSHDTTRVINLDKYKENEKNIQVDIEKIKKYNYDDYENKGQENETENDEEDLDIDNTNDDDDDGDEEEDDILTFPSTPNTKKASNIKLSSYVSSNNDAIMAESSSSTINTQLNHFLKLIENNKNDNINSEQDSPYY